MIAAMANQPSFVQHSVDLFSPLAAVSARSMFGGHGLYTDGLMFGLLDDGELFLKTDDECQAAFVAAGGKRWVYSSRNGPMETRYFQPPSEAMDDSELMKPWFELALGAARRSAEKKGRGKTKKKSAGKAKPKKKA